MSANTQAFMAHLEKLYGAYPKDADGKAETRSDVGRFLLRRYDDNREALAQVLDAIKESCELRYGPPDVAKVKSAIRAFEDEYQTFITAPRPPMPKAPDEPVDKEQALMDLRPLARAAGFNPDTDEHWVFKYAMSEIARGKLAQ